MPASGAPDQRTLEFNFGLGRILDAIAALAH
jgi:hypothetical protein